MREKVLLDTNLLLLLSVGIYDPGYIKSHRRTNMFTSEDFEMLFERLSSASLRTTPNIATEASNLLWYGSDPHKSLIRAVLRDLILSFEESFTASKDLVSTHHYRRLGLTDCGILELDLTGTTILTVDFDLYLAAEELRLKVENFNHHYRVSAYG